MEPTTIQISVPITNTNKLLISLGTVGEGEDTLFVSTKESSIIKKVAQYKKKTKGGGSNTGFHRSYNLGLARWVEALGRPTFYASNS